MTMFSRSPTPLMKREPSPVPSSFSASSSVVKVKKERNYTGPKKGKKRSSNGGRKGEPRRCQNMIAQKKYRDKKVHASSLVSCYFFLSKCTDLQMSDTIVDIKAVLAHASPKKRLELVSSLMSAYDSKMKGKSISYCTIVPRLMADLDPNLASKQNTAAKNQTLQYE
jgi:hypothetical protein